MSSSLHLLAGDANGWFLATLSFACVLMSSTFRRDQNALLAAWVCIFAYQVAAITHCYLFMLPSGGLDAASFQREACEVASGRYNSVISEPEMYVRFLGLVYSWFGPSHFLGCQTSVLAFALSLVVFVKLVDLLAMERWRSHLMVLYSLLPAHVLYCSVTLRESIQLLCVMTLVWCAIVIRDKPGYLAPHLGLVACAVMLPPLHNGFAIYSVGMTMVSLLWAHYEQNKVIAIGLSGFIFLLLIVPGSPLLSHLARTSNVVQEITTGKFAEYLSKYREGADQARANYGLHLRTDSLAGLLTSAPLVVIYYLYSPFPWQVTGLSDLYALTESLLRMGMTVGVFFTFRALDKSRLRQRFFFVLLAFLALEILWSAGSINWGQAIRHRLVGWSLFVLLAGGGICRAFFDDKVIERGGAVPGAATG